MTDREKAIRELQARRAARGMSDPLNRLTRYIETAIANGESPVEEISVKG